MREDKGGIEKGQGRDRGRARVRTRKGWRVDKGVMADERGMEGGWVMEKDGGKEGGRKKRWRSGWRGQEGMQVWGEEGRREGVVLLPPSPSLSIVLPSLLDKPQRRG